MYSEPSVRRLETREVYSWSSAAALPETQHISTRSHSLTNHHEFQHITETTRKFNSLSNHKELKIIVQTIINSVSHHHHVIITCYS